MSTYENIQRMPNLPFGVRPDIAEEYKFYPNFLDRCKLEVTVQNLKDITYTMTPSILQQAPSIIEEMWNRNEIDTEKEKYLFRNIQQRKYKHRDY